MHGQDAPDGDTGAQPEERVPGFSPFESPGLPDHGSHEGQAQRDTGREPHAV